MDSVEVGTPNGEVIIINENETISFGRNKYGIEDNRLVSREHATLTFTSTKETKKLILTTASSMSSTFIYKQSQKIIILPPKDIIELHQNDKFSLIQKTEQYFTILKAPQLTTTKEETIDDDTLIATTNTPEKKQTYERSSSFLQPTETALVELSEIQFIKVVGSGSCGEVWKAEWNSTTVAVKKIFRSLINDSVLKEFLSEAKILRFFFLFFFFVLLLLIYFYVFFKLFFWINYLNEKALINII